MVYMMLEMLVSVFALMILAFIACAAVLLAREALTDAYRALQEAGGVVSRLAVARRGHSLEGSRKALLADVEWPVLPANIAASGAEHAQIPRQLVRNS